MNLKGSLPLLILHSLADGPKHGYRIAKDIKSQSQGVLDFKEGTLYPTLHGLEKQGLIEAYSAMENGRERRYYRLTDNGRESLEHELEEWQRYANAVSMVLKGAASQ
jgi:transcriptional regulator